MRWRRAFDKAVELTALALGLAPEVLKPVRAQLGVPDGVLDILMA
jgi:hypothetical protein